MYEWGDGCKEGGQNAQEISALQKKRKKHERKKQSADAGYYIIGCTTELWPDIKESKEKERKGR